MHNPARLLNEHRALAMLLVLFVALSAFAPNFLSVHNVTTILKGASLNAVAAVGFTLVLILGGMMVYDLMRNMWSWNESYTVSSKLMDMIVGHK